MNAITKPPSNLRPSTDLRIKTPPGKSSPAHQPSGSPGSPSPRLSQTRTSTSAGLHGIPQRQRSMSAKSTSPTPGGGMDATEILNAAQTAVEWAGQASHFMEIFASKPKPADTPAKPEGEATLEAPAQQTEQPAETADAPKPERFLAGTFMEKPVALLRKINPVLSGAMTKGEEARANGENVAVGVLKGYGESIYGAVKGVASGVSTAMTTGLAVETLNPIGLAALVGGSAYAGASKNSADAPEFVKNIANKLV
jgi:hypothetical protein